MGKMKYIIITKKMMVITVFAVFAVVIAMCVSAAVLPEMTANADGKKLPIYCAPSDKKTVSLSFDAAWGNEDTEQLISILKQYNVKATFFVVGEWVDKYPESVKALSDAGHEIMNHSNTHPDMIKLSKTEMAEEINACNDKIEKITGKRPTLFRAPYGSYNNTLIEVLEEMGMHCIQWDVDSLDWKDYTADKIYNRVTGKVQNGSICLFHNAAKHTPEALGDIIEKLQADGYTLLPISENIYKGEFTLDHEGRQVPKQTGAVSTTSIKIKTTK